MYPKNNLVNFYENNYFPDSGSKKLRDTTCRYTLSIINKAINCCEKWDDFLDIGAGDGRYSIPLIYKFKRGVAIEPSQNEFLEKLSENYINLEVKNDYIQNIIFEKTFDFIMLADLFEHIPCEGIPEFVDNLSNLQNVGGVIYLLTPNVLFCGPAEKSDIYFTKHKNGHYKHYTKNEIVNIFRGKGYELIFSSYEENVLKQKFSIFFWGISRRIKIIEKIKILYPINFIFIFFLNLVFSILSNCIFRNERKHSNDLNSSVSLALIFKKLI